ncbi:hypothetical protein BGX27_000191 [Mortierella sp. AM989]|nr:hypothetical protein BGX27_000191 [Mortierella sp. AM989]
MWALNSFSSILKSYMTRSLLSYFTEVSSQQLTENYAVGSQTHPLDSNKASNYAVEFFVNDDNNGLPVLLLEIKPELNLRYISTREGADMQARSRFSEVMNENPSVSELFVISAIGNHCCVYFGRRTAQGIEIVPAENLRDPRFVNDTAPVLWWNIDLLTDAGRTAIDAVFERVKAIRPNMA